MPRRARLVDEMVPLHIVQRGNNRQPCFFQEADYLVFLQLLAASAGLNDCEIHAYVLMTNHVHLLITPAKPDAASLMMKSLGENYVRYVNKRYARVGTLWQGRFHSCLVQDELYLMVCHRYIELNPVRAGMVVHPADYRWSSHRCNGYGDQQGLITPHSLYQQLGNDPAARQTAYRALFDSELQPDTLSALRAATKRNFALGNAAFTAAIVQEAGYPIHSVPGRPSRA